MWPLLLCSVLQSAFAADGDAFAPSSSLAFGTGTLQGESPSIMNKGPSFGLMADTAQDLVVYQYDSGGEAPILGEVLGTTLYGGYTIENRARIDLFLPFYPYVEAPWPNERATSGYQGFGFGDVRLQSTIPLVGQFDSSFQLAVVPRIGLPTGMKKAYLSRGAAVGATMALGGLAADGHFGWLGNAGVTISPKDEIEGVAVGSSVDGVGGAWWRFDDQFRAGGELTLSLGLPKGDSLRDTSSTGSIFAETNLPSGIGMTIGAGTGLIAGIGAPDYRMFAAISYGNAVHDKDKDGIYDKDDACPTDPEDFDDFEDTDGCPEKDNDKDGIEDLVDSCRNEPEDIDGFADADGCPDLDNDHDDIVDTKDACPMVPGTEEFQGCPDTDLDHIRDEEDACPEDPGPKETQGCPDRDGDLVPDFRDQCPDQPRPADEDPAISDGCPKKVYIVGKQIHIADKVFFETGKSTIKKESFGLLDQVADVLKKSTWIQKIEVAGHTDDVGSDSMNQRLSQARAQAVVDYLVKKDGIDAGRLTAKGYGESEPIDTNRTDVGRQNNRRVEFNILQQSPPTISVPRAPAKSGAQPATGGKVTPPGTSGTTPGTTAPGTTAPGTTTKPPGTTGSQPSTATKPPPGAKAFLTVNVGSVSYADVYVDDVKLSKAAPFTSLQITAGTHTIEVVNVKQGLDYTTTINVAEGQTATVNAGAKGSTGDNPWNFNQPSTPETPAGPKGPAGGGNDDPWR